MSTMEREDLASASAEIRRRFFADPLAVFPETELADLLDCAVVARLKPVLTVSAACSVLAAGGYGRQTLHPSSDLDFLILFRTDVDGGLVSEVLAALGDLGFEVGHQERLLSGFSHFDESQVGSYTAFFDARHLCGTQELSGEFSEGALKVFIASHRVSFLRAIASMRRQRLASLSSEGLDVAEPDVKDGVGALRDYHSACWIARVGGTGVPESIRAAAVFQQRIRNFLHYLSGRDENLLKRDYQAEIAAILGFSVRQLMDGYLTSARTIADGLMAIEAEARSRSVLRDRGPTQTL